jgi:hypothetical protein
MNITGTPTELRLRHARQTLARSGVLAGALTRMQGLAQDGRRALLRDAALFVTAQESGLTLVSGNLSDMDLLLQAGGAANVLLYVM